MEISATIRFLGDILGKVITELESPALFMMEERIRLAAKERRAGVAGAAGLLQGEVEGLSLDAARAVAAAFTSYFDLVNLAEENQRSRQLAEREKKLHPAPIDESVGQAIAALKAAGVPPRQMQELLDGLSIELVLTAHPTESRRRSIISKLQRVSRLLEALSNNGLTPRQSDKIRGQIHAQIVALWLTDRHRTARLSVTDEVRTGLYYLESVFWEAMPDIYRDLEQALEQHYPEVHAPIRWLSLASWVGGDRDGNPFVTHQVTAETLRLHRGLAVEMHRQSLHDLSRLLSLSSNRLPPPKLGDWIEARRPLPPHVAYIEERYASEPYRLALSLLVADLKEASSIDMAGHLLERTPQRARIDLARLRELMEIINTNLPRPLAQAQIWDVRRQLDIFGLHAMRLDIREESSRFNATLDETLRALGIVNDFLKMEEQEKIALLVQLLEEEAPALSAQPGVTPATAETWSLFRLLARAREIYGNDLLGPVVISMSRSAADVLAVLVLARWSGCANGLQIVPLFETIDDLQAAPGILDVLFRLPAYRRHVSDCGEAQMVMIGYSDSNKDGGYVMANWALYRGQENITHIAQLHEIKLTIFHGRGGTIARGGGPANRAIRAQPAGSINGRFRLTEQGETIASRYSNPALAHRHLEQIVHAVLLASAPEIHDEQVLGTWRSGMDAMSRTAQRAYRSLVYETAGFLDFWQNATPLDEIKRLHFGSRPAARGGTGEVSKIRAIPWVFSWMQSRFNLPGWFGLGTALASHFDPGLLREMYQGWSFFKSMLDNTEMSLIKADMEIASLYVQLVPDAKLGREIFNVIRTEYERTRELVLAISGHNNLLDDEPVTQTAVQLRNPYVDPLNYIQVEMLKRMRTLPDADGGEANALREVIRLTINGIAAGLRNTG